MAGRTTLDAYNASERVKSAKTKQGASLAETLRDGASGCFVRGSGSLLTRGVGALSVRCDSNRDKMPSEVPL